MGKKSSEYTPDAVRGHVLFASDNHFGIPVVPRVRVVPTWMAPWRWRAEFPVAPGGAQHFFAEESKFESLWVYPRRCLDRIALVGMVVSPDVALHRIAPMACQVWNVYRNRWLACSWADQGGFVIPAVSWAEQESFEYAFLGVSRNSTVAVSTHGVEDWRAFHHGLVAMVERLAPYAVLLCGPSLPPECAAPRGARTYHYAEVAPGRPAARPTPLSQEAVTAQTAPESFGQRLQERRTRPFLSLTPGPLPRR